MIEKNYRPLVYICSRYSGDTGGNLERTREFCRFALEQGQIPLSGVLAFASFMDDEDPEERRLAIFADMILMGKCDELWVLVTEEGISSGMEAEIGRAKKRQQKIRWFNEKYEEVEAV